MSEKENLANNPQNTSVHANSPIGDMYQHWFLDYASYVILERAVPAIEDGLKPVQRRILHAMKEMDDGRYNKVANIIGQTMQYHPHGDASIGEAIINVGQKEFLIDTQGNWGDLRTGDSAAAARYIEARLSPFALDILYSPQITTWQLSYDGRKKEPVTFPVKFPLLLLQGAEGIAVGLATKILPHNFKELIEGSIAILRGQKPTILPDFPTGGLVDCTAYNDGMRGGRIRVRARIEVVDKKTLAIRDIPYSATTHSLIESIVKAHEKGKIKIKQVIDNTAQEVEILVHLAAGQSPEVAIDALYVFTDCEINIAPNACVIVAEKPAFLGITELLTHSTYRTRDLLYQELLLEQQALQEKILSASLEKIFIENRIYRQIEECTTWEAVLETIGQGLEPYKGNFYRPIVEEDLVKMTELKIKRISKYDSHKMVDTLLALEETLAQVSHNLDNLTEYTIQYFNNLLHKYSAGKERKTVIRTFGSIQAHSVAVINQKLYVNRKAGFLGYGLKKDELVGECSDLDEIIVFRKNGKCLITKVAEKVFVGKDIMHVAIYKRNDERKVYNLVYLDGATGISRVKRFQMLGMVRDKAYDLTKGHPDSQLLYLTANPNGEAETIQVMLSPGCAARNKIFEFAFATLEVKSRNVQGNILTKYPIKKIRLKEVGKSTLGGRDIWYDPTVGRLNTDARGKRLGSFQHADRLLAILKDGCYVLTDYSLTNRYNPDEILLLEKFDPQQPLSVVYYEGKTKQYYVKRFLVETTSLDKKFNFLPDKQDAKLILATTNSKPQLAIQYSIASSEQPQILVYDLEVVGVKGWKSLGNRLSKHEISQVKLANTQDECV
jgi:topoisomerase-4 subunit A